LEIGNGKEKREIMGVDLSVDFAGVAFPNPIVAASAPVCNSLKNMETCVRAGVGGIVLKSITPEPAPGQGYKYPRPRYKLVFDGKSPRSNFSMFETESHNNLSCAGYADLIREARRSFAVPIIASIQGWTDDDWKRLATLVADAGASMVEMNLSHPVSAGYSRSVTMVGQDAEESARLTKLVKSCVDVPVIPKLTPQTNDLVYIAHAIRQAGADGVVAINGFAGLDIDVETELPALDTISSYLGSWLKGHGLRWVAEISSKLDIPIAGSGGVVNWQDAVAYTLVGATIVQIATAPMIHGYGLFEEVISGYKSYLERKGFSSPAELRGRSLRYIRPSSHLEKAPPVAAVVEGEKCIDCKKCAEVCLYDAVSFEGGVAEISRSRCDGCGLCAQVCPTRCISLLRFEKDTGQAG
jgi:dihydroorotate dehydrogenase subfamily 1